MAGHVENVSFPSAKPKVMNVEGTFWEQVVATHVYCIRGRIRGERYARHWHYLAALARSRYFAGAIADKAVANDGAQHKFIFFSEGDSAGARVDFYAAVKGNLHIVPAGPALQVLAQAYAFMLSDQVMVGPAFPFDDLMQAWAMIEARANQAATKSALISPTATDQKFFTVVTFAAISNSAR